jgi:hypothetical protein
MWWRRLGHLALGVWGIISIGLLGQYLYEVSALTNGAENIVLRGELGVKLGWSLLILNFPLSLVVASLGSLVPVGGLSGPVADWCVLSLTGFVQWAIVTPALVRRFRGSTEQRADGLRVP